MPSRSYSRTEGPGRYAYEGLDRLLHERARLGILMALGRRREGRLFRDLKNLCGLTDGNLSRHLDALVAAGLVEVRKGFEGRKPQTGCVMTDLGRGRFKDYLRELRRVVRDGGVR